MSSQGAPASASARPGVEGWAGPSGSLIELGEEPEGGQPR